MTNPFKSKETETVEVTNSELYCDKCAFVTDTGIYYPAKHRLVFICPNAHVNKLEIDLD